MAEYQVVQQHLYRMCKKYKCEECSLSSDNNGSHLSCSNFCQRHSEVAEEIIMKWAAEHPKPKYPTWHQLLVSHGCIPNVCSAECLSNAVQCEIPEKAAKDLGIEPINS